MGKRLDSLKNKSSHGGKRAGAGRPNGAKGRQTLEKEAAMALLREKIGEEIGPLVQAQIDAAIGIRHLMFRDPKSRKCVRAADEKQMDLALKLKDEGGESLGLHQGPEHASLQRPDEPDIREAGRSRASSSREP